MPKKPNFDFERRQREKAKALKTADKAQAKKQKMTLVETGAAATPDSEKDAETS